MSVNNKLVPWLLDGKDVDQPLHMSESAEDYLSPSSLKDAKALLGAKGTGKTLLLRKRNKAIHQSRERNLWAPEIFPKDGFCEVIRTHIWQASARERDLLSSPKYWCELWICATVTVAAFHEMQYVQKSLESLFGKENPPLSVSAVLSTWFASPERRMLRSNRASIEAEVYSTLHQLKKDYCFFLDDADEAGAENATQTQMQWRVAQRGLLLATHRLAKITNRIRIFTTVRPQAMKCPPNPEWQEDLNIQLHDRITRLNYRKSDLFSVFEMHCKATEETYLSNEFEAPAHRFLKLESISVNGEQEEALHYVWRHSFGRPRDMIFIGKKIMSKSKHTEEEFRDIVNTSATELLFSYIDEIFKFGKEAVLGGLRHIATNVVYPDELHTIDRIVEKTMYFDRRHIGGEKGHTSFKHWSAHAQAAGLVGVPTQRQNKQFELKYETGGLHVYPDEKASLPHACYYVLHPATYHFLRTNRKSSSHTPEFDVSMHGACDGLLVPATYDRGTRARMHITDEILHIGDEKFELVEKDVPVLIYMASVLTIHSAGKPVLSSALRTMYVHIMRAIGYDSKTPWSDSPNDGDYGSFSNHRLRKPFGALLKERFDIDFRIEKSTIKLTCTNGDVPKFDCQSMRLLEALGGAL